MTPRPGMSRRGRARVGSARVAVPERADARLRPETPMGGSGARLSETAEGLKNQRLIVSAMAQIGSTDLGRLSLRASGGLIRKAGRLGRLGWPVGPHCQWSGLHELSVLWMREGAREAEEAGN